MALAWVGVVERVPLDYCRKRVELCVEVALHGSEAALAIDLAWRLQIADLWTEVIDWLATDPDHVLVPHMRARRAELLDPLGEGAP